MNVFTQFINSYVHKGNLIEIDFKESWLSIFFKQKAVIAVVALYVLIDDITISLFPILIGKILESQSYVLLFAIIAMYVVIEIAGWFFYHPYLVRFFTQTLDGFRYSAYRYFLYIDPLDHGKHSSGVLIGKIQRATIAYSDFADTVIDETLPIFIETTTVIILMSIIDLKLGLITGISIYGISAVFVSLSSIMTHKMEQETIEQDDKVNHIGIESIYQFAYIRASFFTRDFIREIGRECLKALRSQLKVWFTLRLIRGLFIVVYLLILGIVIGYLLHMVNAALISKVMATTLVMTYLRGTKGIFSIDKRIKVILRSYRRIKDFYSFAREFGSQEIMIDVNKELVNIKYDSLSVSFEHITFGYSSEKLIFNNNSFNLDLPRNEEIKLYGIIGPSGMGKTTLISMLGGQLKPFEGTIRINDINIYGVTDEVKRQLIALQGQVSSSFKGSLEHNLLFGLPENQSIYTQDDLIQVLKQVGLWTLFEAKEGLDTEIGDAGTNLSGGQRQRLCFANLYLRAKFYKPILILIDEPTSSLDEISELAITKMIHDLALESITFVIAHRLKTLKDAKAILDLSTMQPDAILEFLPLDYLKFNSGYYQMLVFTDERE